MLYTFNTKLIDESNKDLFQHIKDHLEKSIKSVSKRVEYKNFVFSEFNIIATRNNTSNQVVIDRKELFKVLDFTRKNNINTTILEKNNLAPYSQSPTLAVLLNVGIIEEK